MKPKKSLGQNFLRSESDLNKIIEVANLTESDHVLEIGPGTGALTEKILQTGAKIVAVEKDPELIQHLNTIFAQEINSGQLEIVAGDILEIEPTEILKKSSKYKLIANIPYYITGQIISKFLSNDFQPQKAVLLVQKEVAERIVAKNHKESILSNSVKVYGEPKIEKVVKAGSFFPRPKVDSAILSISNISKEKFSSNIPEGTFFKVLKAGFAHKRKKLLKNLSEFYNQELLEKIFNDLNIDKNTRAEDLVLNEWLKITEYLTK